MNVKHRCNNIFLMIFAVAAALSNRCAAQSDDDVSCGAYCLTTALLTLDYPPATLERLNEILGSPSSSGYSVEQLQRAAEQLGAHTAAVKTTPLNLSRRERPFVCIALLKSNHFAIIGEISDSTVTVVDPPRTYDLPLQTFATQWDGTALIVSDTTLELEETIASQLRRDYFVKSSLRNGALLLIICAAASTARFFMRRRVKHAELRANE